MTNNEFFKMLEQHFNDDDFLALRRHIDILLDEAFEEGYGDGLKDA